MKRDLLRVADLSRKEMEELFDLSGQLKARQKRKEAYTPLSGKSLGLIFEKPSTRTRVSFEVGIYQLGGQSLFLSSKDLQLGRGETIADTARVLSRYVDGLVIRTFGHEIVEEMARYASIPVINGLSDLHHPCQVLADLFTLLEKGKSWDGLKVAYVGDGNNMAHSWMEGAARLGFHLAVACPEGYEPDREIYERVRREVSRPDARIEIGHDPREAVKGADVVYTDVWTSMGQEQEREERLRAFQGFQLNPSLLSHAKPEVLIMHCLPAHRGEEVTDEIIDGPRSVVWDQAENRLHLQKAILVKFLT
ncbi:MAG: ornithine carbamoyltransferase [candidate division NC10 bacterium]|nr:ornithine carbamoyltransferase [candidate division NC10 bacterium]